jgi:hypothetical protein
MNLKRGAPSGSPPRFLLRKPTIEVAPVPAGVVTLEYVSSYWVRSTDATLRPGFLDDSDVSLIPEDIIVLGMKWRWRRMKGRPFDDELTEYEAAFDYRARTDRSIRLPQVTQPTVATPGAA